CHSKQSAAPQPASPHPTSSALTPSVPDEFRTHCRIEFRFRPALPGEYPVAGGQSRQRLGSFKPQSATLLADFAGDDYADGFSFDPPPMKRRIPALALHRIAVDRPLQLRIDDRHVGRSADAEGAAFDL